MKPQRALTCWLLVGCALVALRRALPSGEVIAAEPPVVVVAQTDDLDESLQVWLAERAGAALGDPVVRDRLLRNMRFAGEQGDDDTLLDRALAMGMQRRDPVARRRLQQAGRRLLLRSEPPFTPSDAALSDYLQRHQQRYARPPRARFRQLFVANERSEAHVAHLAQQLAELDAQQGTALSDPLLLPARWALSDTRRIDGRFGRGFAAGVLEAPLRRWHGPIRSSFGRHFVWLDERRDAESPPLTEVRQLVLDDYRRDEAVLRVRRALDRLRQHVRLEVLP